MMDLPNISKETFVRGSDGQLLPKLVPVVLPPEQDLWWVWMIPLTIGELREVSIEENLYNDGDSIMSQFIMDNIKFVNDRFFPESEFKFIRRDWFHYLGNTLLYHSGVGLDELLEKEEKPFLRKKTEFQKTISSQVRKASSEGQMYDFLHDKGIPYFKMPNLCNFEIRMLVDGYNDRQKVN